MNDIAPPDALAVLRERAHYLRQECAMIEARLAEVEEMMTLLEPAKRRAGRPRTRTTETPPEYFAAPDEPLPPPS